MSANQVIDGAIAHLRQLTQQDIQTHWRLYHGDLPLDTALNPQTWAAWTPASLNDRGHVAWSRGRQVLWLGHTLVIPAHLHGYPLADLALRLSLTWWAEAAQIFVDGVLVQEGDLFDCSVERLLKPAVVPQERVTVAIRLVSPGHDDGALVRSRYFYENPDQSLDPAPEPGFVADELAVLQRFLRTFDPEQLSVLAEAVQTIPWEEVGDREGFQRAIAHLRDQLQPFSPWMKQRRIGLLGHAHLDLAWLWEISDTWEAAQRTFTSVLDLQRDYPDLIFTHSTPALYTWIEEHRPDLFQAIQRQVAAGIWEVAAGLWVEPELNLVGGESIVRQVLYGQRYTQEKFGHLSRIAWLPDSFGFCWQLPQILAQGGVDYFVTQKLRWNDTTEFPHEIFWWRSPDGTPILSLTAPPIGTPIDPLQMADYACQWEAKTGQSNCLWLPGVGDHGGGPTREMLEQAQRWGRSPFFPQLEFTTAAAFLDKLVPTSLETPATLPCWNDELYLEFHRGCYTTHADQKQANRRCEALLYQAELYASLATLLTHKPYPRERLEAAWKSVLFNQFHDILPGSAIPEVYAEVNPVWQAVAAESQQVIQQSLGAIAPHITLPTPPIANARPLLIFNSLNWLRSEVVAFPLPDSSATDGWQVYDTDGQSQPSQVQPRGGLNEAELLLFRAEKVPSLGYRLFWLRQEEVGENGAIAPPNSYTLENEYLRVEIDPETGDVASLYDRTQQREVLSAPGNQLQAFQDQGQYWDAWNIDPDYGQHPLPPAQLQSISWLEDGPVQSRIRVVRRVGQSEFRQDYILQAGSDLLKIETQVDWQERHTLVKVAFPFQLSAAVATYEMPFGAIRRSPHPSTPQEQAKWEVPALNWADLSTEDYGVSLLSDYKQGYDATPDQLRLTLLRGACWPDPDADRGPHQFTYAVYPHSKSWQTAQTVHRGYELQQPLWAIPWRDGKPIAPNPSAPRSPALPPCGSLINLTGESVILSALKPAEDGANGWIARFYEWSGQSGKVAWGQPLFPWLAEDRSIRIEPTDLLERVDIDPGEKNRTQGRAFRGDAGSTQGSSHRLAILPPWRIQTFCLKGDLGNI
ncbi:MAG: alpha-mannosidase [Synechococcales bacterium]|nr:alpha-mannosidase [Synechococcales bacterium]